VLLTLHGAMPCLSSLFSLDNNIFQKTESARGSWNIPSVGVSVLEDTGLFVSASANTQLFRQLL
jgi:hypothetical protein